MAETMLDASNVGIAKGREGGYACVAPAGTDPTTFIDMTKTLAELCKAPSAVLKSLGYISEDGVTVTSYPNGKPEPGKLYDASYLARKNKYAYFLGGNQPLCVVRSETPGAEGKLLLVRDSYADSLTPFLTERFAEIHLIDLRYYRASLQDYIRENGIDRVLVLYGFSNFTTDRNLFLLAK